MHTQNRVVQASRGRRVPRQQVTAARTNRRVGSRWRAAAVAMSLGCAAASASAQDWFSFEAGLGATKESAINDGNWYQRGAPVDSANLTAPVFLAGFTGTAWQHGPWSLDWHADYTYLGTISASCYCVPDDDYDAHVHQIKRLNAPVGYFNGQGHTQGVALTLAPGYTWGQWRLSIEGGAWIFWQTWHEYTTESHPGVDVIHPTAMQVGYVAGARIERGPISVSYRYYDMPVKWAPYPGMVRGAHVLTATYKVNMF